jgi:HlyD family secretion protein
LKKNAILIIILVLISGGILYWYLGVKKKTKPVTLETTKPEYGYISTNVTATGTIEPVDTVNVGSQVSGTIKAIYADFNDRVKKGQLIAELDKSIYQAAVDQYEANLQQAKSNLVYQKANFDRQTILFDSVVISKSDMETARYQYESAVASVKSIQAQLDGAQKNLSYTNIYSPINGVVLTRNISAGQTVASSFNTPTLFIIAKDITKMQVQAAVDEADIGNVKSGQSVDFSVDAFPNSTFTGRVREIRLQPIVSANVVTYTTIIDAPNEDLKLKPGMTANIFIYTKVDSNALLIPSKALQFKPDSSLNQQFVIIRTEKKEMVKKETTPKQFPVNPSQSKNPGQHSESATQSGTVWTQSGDSLLEKNIGIGINDDTHVQVLDGLTDSDLVVIGISNQGVKSAGEKQVKSPFMPTRRPKPTTPRNKTASAGP